MEKINYILASNSARRKELLKQIGIEFTVMPSDIEENSDASTPEDLVTDLASKKALDVYEKCHNESPYNAGTWVYIGSDTVVAKDNLIFGKPKDRDEALNMLRTISGDTHKVCTGVAIIITKNGSFKTMEAFPEVTTVTVYDANDEALLSYIDKAKPYDKAGAYGIQEEFGAFIKSIEGEYSTVVGLPIGHLSEALRRLL